MRHKKLFLRIFAGIVVILFIMVIYNCIVRTDDDPQRRERAEAEKEHQAMYADTFDVVGDYLFPNQKTSAEDMALAGDKEERDAKAAEKKDREQTQTASHDDEEDEIIESADISSDPTPAPPAPQIEQMGSPTVTSVDD